MARPRTIDGATYRVCPDCGAQRLFDLKTWKMYGAFSYRLLEEASGQTARVLPFESAHTNLSDAGQVLRRAA